MKKTRILVLMGLFISLEVVLTRFIAIETPIIRIGFGFLPIAISAIMFGPVIGGLTATIADIIGMIIAPKAAYFPGLTFSAFMTGFIYGLFLHKKNKSILKIFLAVLTITLAIRKWRGGYIWKKEVFSVGFLKMTVHCYSSLFCSCCYL
jgi:ECF transporter S component (folate family)